MNKYLLDTHVLIWCISSPQLLSEKAGNTIRNGENAIYYSSVSLWEIAIKISIGKLKLDTTFEDLVDKLKDNDFVMIAPTLEAIKLVKDLPFYKDHRDPFDRLLIAVSQSLDLQIITIDEKFDLYPDINRLW